MKRHIAYAKYVLRHKWFVFKACLKLGVPLWIAVFHDWDKFLLSEWFPYARTFYNSDGSKKQYAVTMEFARAWMQHQHLNKHHWQYWCCVDNIPLWFSNIMIWDKGNAQKIVRRDDPEIRYEMRDVDDSKITCDPMPDVYRREMLADWIGAGQALGFTDTAAWYEKNKDNMKLHPETRAWIEAQLKNS